MDSIGSYAKATQMRRIRPIAYEPPLVFNRKRVYVSARAFSWRASKHRPRHYQPVGSPMHHRCNGHMEAKTYLRCHELVYHCGQTSSIHDQSIHMRTAPYCMSLASFYRSFRHPDDHTIIGLVPAMFQLLLISAAATSAMVVAPYL